MAYLSDNLSGVTGEIGLQLADRKAGEESGSAFSPLNQTLAAQSSHNLLQIGNRQLKGQPRALIDVPTPPPSRSQLAVWKYLLASLGHRLGWRASTNREIEMGEPWDWEWAFEELEAKEIESDRKIGTGTGSTQSGVEAAHVGHDLHVHVSKLSAAEHPVSQSLTVASTTWRDVADVLNEASQAVQAELKECLAHAERRKWASWSAFLVNVTGGRVPIPGDTVTGDPLNLGLATVGGNDRVRSGSAEEAEEWTKRVACQVC